MVLTSLPRHHNGKPPRHPKSSARHTARENHVRTQRPFMILKKTMHDREEFAVYLSSAARLSCFVDLLIPMKERALDILPILPLRKPSDTGQNLDHAIRLSFSSMGKYGPSTYTRPVASHQSVTFKGQKSTPIAHFRMQAIQSRLVQGRSIGKQGGTCLQLVPQTLYPTYNWSSQG